MNWHNEITEMLGLRYPIVQAPMLNVSSPAMTAAAAGVGALGTLALGDLPPERCIREIRATKMLSASPFAVNIFVYPLPEVTHALRQSYAQQRTLLLDFASGNGLSMVIPPFEELKLTDYREQVEAILAEGCKQVSFTFGNLDTESIDRLKSAGCTLIGTCTSVAEAQLLEHSGIDIICVQGYEAGGHRGSFAHHHLPDLGGFSLLPQVYEAVKRPLIYAGGIHDAKSLLAAQLLGAKGFQVGSMLLRAEESELHDFEKERLEKIGEADIGLINSFSGRYARGIKNRFTEFFATQPILPYPYQNKLTAPLRQEAKRAQNIDFVSIWTGSSRAARQTASTRVILQGLIDAVETVHGQLSV